MRVWLPLVALVAGCTTSAPVPPQPAPDILVFLVPGLRADAPGVPGAEAAFLEAFEGTPMRRFTAAHAQSASEWVSTGSLLSGRYPGSIPLCGSVRGKAVSEQPWCTMLPRELPSLPAVVGLYGYHAALFMEHTPTPRNCEPGPACLPVSVEEVFRSWKPLVLRGGSIDHERLASGLSELLAAPEPVLALIVLPDLDVQHRPDLRQAMGLPGEPGACEEQNQWASSPRLDGQPGVPEAATPVQASADNRITPVFAPTCTLDTWDPAVDGLPGQPEPTYPWGTLDRDRVLEVYRDEAARLGQAIAGLLHGDDPEPWVVLTSPHGLDLGEVSGSLPAPKRFATHELLLDRTLRVPLVIMGPGITADHQVAQPVELVDLMPTLAGLVGAVPPAGLPGQDLLAPDFALDPTATAYAEFGDMLYLRQGPWALTLRTTTHQATALDPALTEAAAKPVEDRSFHLHRVDQDPLQQRERKGEQQAQAEQLRALMLAMRTGPAAPPEDPETAARLLELRLQGSEGYW